MPPLRLYCTLQIMTTSCSCSFIMRGFDKLARGAELFKKRPMATSKQLLSHWSSRDALKYSIQTLLSPLLPSLSSLTRSSSSRQRLLPIVLISFEQFDSVSSGNFPEKRPENTIPHLFFHLQSEALKNKMRRCLEYGESDQMSVRIFVNIFTQEVSSY